MGSREAGEQENLIAHHLNLEFKGKTWDRVVEFVYQLTGIVKEFADRDCGCKVSFE